jgi:hypothetical protein
MLPISLAHAGWHRRRSIPTGAHIGVGVGHDIVLFEDLQADLSATQCAVMRRGGLLATRLVIAPVLTQAMPPSAQLRSQQDEDDGQQHDVGKMDVICHVAIQFDVENVCQIVFMPPMRSSANYQLLVRAVPNHQIVGLQEGI